MSFAEKLQTSLVQQIKITQKQAGIDQESHQRNVLDISHQRTNSCIALTDAESRRLLERYKKMAPKVEQPPQLRMIYGLWGQIYRAGGVKVGTLAACRTFCKNHLNGQKLEEGHQYWPAIIEVLKKFLARLPQNEAVQHD